MSRLCLLVMLPLLACAAPHQDAAAAGSAGDAAPPLPPGKPGMVTAAFTCPDSTVIYAIFRTDSAGVSTASLAIGDERFVLPQTRSADGARYADSTAVLWNKGNEVTFDRGGKSRVCKGS